MCVIARTPPSTLPSPVATRPTARSTCSANRLWLSLFTTSRISSSGGELCTASTRIGAFCSNAGAKTDRPVTDDSPALSTDRTTPVTTMPRAASTSRTTAAVYRAGSDTGTALRTPLLLRGIWPRTTSGPPYALRDTRIVVDPRCTVVA